MAKVALEGYIDSHNQVPPFGPFIFNTNKVYVNGSVMIKVGDLAIYDVIFVFPSSFFQHNNTQAATGSTSVYINGMPVHRVDDLRDCGAKTLDMSDSNKVFVGD